MLISPPFLPSSVTEDVRENIQYSFTGQYPVTSHLEWHNGVHLVAPVENGAYTDVRAIADGVVLKIVKPDKEPSKDKNHPQNYAAFGDGPEWSDKGMVIIEHKTEIGASDIGATELVFYSVYAHLKSLDAKLPAEGKPIHRKDSIGKAGQIYGQDDHIHFEICLDDENIKRLLGQDPATKPQANVVPTKDGRTDAVFGSTYVYLPASTPTQSIRPTVHTRSEAVQTLQTPQWVQIAYAGKATLISYKTDGTRINERVDVDAEYDLYKEANARHQSLSTADRALSSPSAWYELLRFGRNLGQSATVKDPLPANAAHWRKIQTPAGEMWADLNAAGTYKFSDADFPAFLGWTCIADDTSTADQRCDSVKLKNLITNEVSDPEQKAIIWKDPLQLFAYSQRGAIKPRLRKAICKFPSEFDQGDFEARYGHIKEEEYFKQDPQAWSKLKEHIKALTVVDLPAAYKNAQWHLHPVEFIEAMRKCRWLQKADIKRVFTAITDAHLDAVRTELNKHSAKHFLDSGLRQAHFFGQVRKETGPTMAPSAESLSYAPSALIGTFGYYGSRHAEALADGYAKDTHGHIIKAADQEAIANKAYAGTRLGNDQPGDGWRYRGRGMKQVTGKANYRQFGREYTDYWATDVRDFVANERLLVEMPYALRSAVWFWVANGCMKKADGGMRDRDVDAVTGIVNHGEVGTTKGQERRDFSQAAYKIFE